jgi:hypothetical protein
LNLPAAQSRHALIPAYEYAPAGQSVQFELPFRSLKAPAGQALHADELASENRPAGQIPHTLALAREKVPFPHTLQLELAFAPL